VSVVLRRYWRAGLVSCVNAFTVLSDGERGLRLWQPAGVPYWRLLTPDGRTLHDGSIGAIGPLALTELTWTGSGIMPLHRPGEPWSVWWLFDGASGAFQGWYVNLEQPGVRWRDGAVAGLDTADHALDIRVAPDRSWVWKDEDEFAARTGDPDYWDAAEASRIRAAGERVVALIEAGAFPFDGTWTSHAPAEPGSGAVELPAGWDRPSAL
jgi:hypothetical protein